MIPRIGYSVEFWLVTPRASYKVEFKAITPRARYSVEFGGYNTKGGVKRRVLGLKH